MVLDRARAEPEAGGDLLGVVAGDHQVHHLPLARRQRGHSFDHRDRLGPPPAPLGVELDALLDPLQQVLVVERLLQEVDRAGLHRPDRGGHVGVSGDHHRRAVVSLLGQFLEQLEAGHPRHLDVEDQAADPGRLVVAEERLGGGVALGLQSRGLDQETQRFSDAAVVVDDEDGRVMRQHGEPP